MMSFGMFVMLVLIVVVFFVVFVSAGAGSRRVGPMMQRGCPQCGATHPHFARFCRQCGNRIG